MRFPDALRDQARSCTALGSPFMGRLLTLLADHMFQRGPGEGRLALAWAGSEGGTRGAAVLERGGAR